VVQRCQFVDDCFVWTDEDDCHNEGLRCAILQDQARCHCRDGCEIGDRRCSESTQTIEHCIVGSDGCRRWSEVSRCHERGRVCATTEARPVCACPEQCPLGVTRCAENTLQVCSLTEYSCATWLDVAEQTDGGLDSGTTCANEDCGDGSACPSSTDGGSLDQAS
jgi:hypothetical protein